MSFVDKLFGNKSEKEIKKTQHDFAGFVYSLDTQETECFFLHSIAKNVDNFQLLCK